MAYFIVGQQMHNSVVYDSCGQYWSVLLDRIERKFGKSGGGGVSMVWVQ